MRSFLRYHLPLILYSALVIIISSVPNLRGPELRFVAFDKVAHFIEYAVFAFLAFRSFSRWSTGTAYRAFLLTGLFLVLFAVLDEIYQGSIPGRHSDPIDILVDVAGAFLVLILLLIRQKYNQKG